MRSVRRRWRQRGVLGAACSAARARRDPVGRHLLSDMPTAPRCPGASGNVTVEGVITDRDGPAAAMFLVFGRFPFRRINWADLLCHTDLSGAFRVVVTPRAYEVRISGNYEGRLPSMRIPKFEVRRLGPGSITVTRARGSPVLSLALVDHCLTKPISQPPATQTYANARTVGGRYPMLLPPGRYRFHGEPRIHFSGFRPLVRGRHLHVRYVDGLPRPGMR
jgi:hypothetical protein